MCLLIKKKKFKLKKKPPKILLIDNIKTGDTNYIYKSDLDKACFQHGMSHGKYKDLNKRTKSDKVLKDKAFKIASNLKYVAYQRELASMV